MKITKRTTKKELIAEVKYLQKKLEQSISINNMYDKFIRKMLKDMSSRLEKDKGQLAVFIALYLIAIAFMIGSLWF